MAEEGIEYFQQEVLMSGTIHQINNPSRKFHPLELVTEVDPDAEIRQERKFDPHDRVSFI
jgi:hypothetical protein